MSILSQFNPLFHPERCGYRKCPKTPEAGHPARRSSINGFPVVTGQSSPFLAKNVNSSNFWRAFLVSSLRPIRLIRSPRSSLHPWCTFRNGLVKLSNLQSCRSVMARNTPKNYSELASFICQIIRHCHPWVSFTSSRRLSTLLPMYIEHQAPRS